jgi:radical SAM protein with 4Fe4S-binding SPASM domain
LHCGSACNADAAIPDMPFDDFLQAILPLQNRYARDSITGVISGGEPLLREDLPYCGRSLREQGFRWGLVTNGYGYTPAIHARLRAAGIGAVSVSLDGLEQTHNWLRANPRSFEHALDALALIRASKGLAYDVVTCVNPRNLAELAELKALLIAKKVTAWRLFTIAPIGRASHRPDMQLQAGAIVPLMDFIAASRRENHLALTFSGETYVGRYERQVRDAYFFCRAGINIASVLIDGAISVCPNNSRHVVQGSIYHDAFLDVWDHRFIPMRERSWTKTGRCLHCKEYPFCQGGALHLWDEKQDTIMTCILQRGKL